jgi:hypothetical protein
MFSESVVEESLRAPLKENRKPRESWRRALMLLFASIVKVFLATPFIALFSPKAKSILRLAGRINDGTFTRITR